MKDLYKRIGLSSQTNNLSSIRTAINNCNAPYALKESARYILLDTQRKNVYDRNHKLLKVIGQVRANMGLNKTAPWLSTECEDFDCEPSIPKNELSKQDKESPIYSFFSGLFRLFKFVLIRLIILGVIVGVLCIIGLVADFSENSPRTKIKHNYSPPSNNYTSPRKSPQYTKPTIQFNEPSLPLPYNGHVIRHHNSEAIAPLEIKTRSGSGNYFVKLAKCYTNATVLTVFVREGQTVNIDVPLGSYELKYAVGKTWYGTKHLFGPNTSCSKADERFDFKQNSDQVSGYTIELYLQTHGNLETDPIPVSEF